MKAAALLALSMLLGAANVNAAARFSTVFAPHMVLQRGQPIELWGFGASPSASDLSVHIGSAAAMVYWPVGADGSWRAVLPAMHGFGCNGTALVLKSGGQALQTLGDICIGDVYLFSGQSNIDLAESYANQFDAAAQAKEEAFADANPDIRLMVVCPNPTHNGGKSPPFTTAPAKELADVPDDPNCAAPFDAAGKYSYCQTDAMKWARANGTNIRGFSLGSNLGAENGFQRLARNWPESERGVWFSWKRYGICTPQFQ